MTTISNINIVVQQGEPAKEAQHVRNPQLDAHQLTPAQQAQKEMEARGTVNESEESEKIKTDQEESGERERSEQERKKKKQQQENLPDEGNPDGTGRLLDTIA